MQLMLWNVMKTPSCRQAYFSPLFLCIMGWNVTFSAVCKEWMCCHLGIIDPLHGCEELTEITGDGSRIFLKHAEQRASLQNKHTPVLFKHFTFLLIWQVLLIYKWEVEHNRTHKRSDITITQRHLLKSFSHRSDAECCASDAMEGQCHLHTTSSKDPSLLFG